MTAVRGVGGRRSGTNGMLAVGLVDDWSSSRVGVQGCSGSVISGAHEAFAQQFLI